MSKGGIKKKNREPSQRCRAARRETSPKLNAGPSIREASPATQKVDSRPAIRSIHHNAGVSKKTGRKAIKTTKQRRRQERGISRAEAVADITARKIERSMAQEKTVKGRKKTWDDVNKYLTGGKQTKCGFELLGEEDGENDIEVVVKANPFAAIPIEVDMDAHLITIVDDAAPAPGAVPEVIEMKDDDDDII